MTVGALLPADTTRSRLLKRIRSDVAQAFRLRWSYGGPPKPWRRLVRPARHGGP